MNSVRTGKKTYWMVAGITLLLLNPAFISFAETISYHYDNMRRLDYIEDSNGREIEYIYDKMGNRMSMMVRSKRISGSGFYYPEAGFRGSLTLDINAASPGKGSLAYYYSKRRINLVSTKISGLSFEGKIVEISGEGSVNGFTGYTFVITITDDVDDSIEIVIRNPEGQDYFSSESRVMVSGGFNVDSAIISQNRLFTFLSPEDAGTIVPDCSAGCVFESGTLALLTANENNGYYFDGWSGCDSAYGSVCIMTVDDDKNVTANFHGCFSPVRILREEPLYFSTLQEAYDSAIEGDVIQSRSGNLMGDLSIDRDISITLQGGYECRYESVTGYTELKGSITLTNGRVSIDNLRVR